MEPRNQVWTIPTASATGLSNAIDLQSLLLCGFDVAAMTATTTKLSFWKCGTETGTYLQMYERDGTLFTAACDATTARSVQVEPGLFAGLRWVKVQAVNDSDVAVQQTTTARVVTPTIRMFG